MSSDDLQSRETAVLLIAHGSRRAAANDDLVHLADRLRTLDRYRAVEVSYLELAEPTIPDGAAACVAQGVARVLMLPYFLSAGEHVVRDLEQHCEELRARHRPVVFTLCPPLGLHPLMTEIVLQRLQEGAAKE